MITLQNHRLIRAHVICGQEGTQTSDDGISKFIIVYKNDYVPPLIHVEELSVTGGWVSLVTG